MSNKSGRTIRRGAVFGLMVFIGLFTLDCRNWKKMSIEDKANHIAKKITKELDLNDTQKTALEKLKTEAVAKIKANKGYHEEITAQLIVLVKSEKMDKSKLKELRKKRTSMMTEMEDFMIEKVAEFHATLTPEQKVKAAEHIEKMSKRMHHN